MLKFLLFKGAETIRAILVLASQCEVFLLVFPTIVQEVLNYNGHKVKCQVLLP